MSRIVRAYVEEAPKQTLSLLKSINGLEEGVWDNLKAVMGGSSKKAATPADNAPDRATTDSNSANLSTTLTKMVDELLSTADDRYVIFTTLNFVAKYYLKAGGGQAVITQVKDDEDLKKIAAFEVPENSQIELRKLQPKFQFTDLINTADPSFNAVIILDIPKTLSTELETEKSSGNAKKIRDVLTKMMSFKYYVMTLSLGKAKAAGPAINKAKTLEDKAAVFNPDIIANYPVKNTLDAAKIEWKNEHGDTAEPADAEEKEEKTAERPGDGKQEVSKTPSGGLDLNKSILDSIIAGQGDADKISQGLFFTLNKHFDLHTVENAIIELQASFGNSSVLSKLNAILTSQYADQWERKQPAGDKSKPKTEPEAPPAAS